VKNEVQKLGEMNKRDSNLKVRFGPIAFYCCQYFTPPSNAALIARDFLDANFDFRLKSNGDHRQGHGSGGP
jgi:hypothetical protein